LCTPRRAVLANVGRGDEVERAGAEAVLRTGERADRADLDRVAGEVGVERFLIYWIYWVLRVAAEHADLLVGRTLHQVDEPVAGDLVGEAGAALAQYTALAVEQHLRRDRDRLRILALALVEPAVAVAVAHRLVLQRALAALVAH